MPLPTILSNGPDNTQELGKKLADFVLDGDILLLSGDLGAGKTCLTKGLAIGLGVKDIVISPTFVLFREYNGRIPLFHIDLYRGSDDTYLETGATDVAGVIGVTVVEWGDHIEELMKRSFVDHLVIRIVIGADETSRELILEPHGTRASQLAKEWSESS